MNEPPPATELRAPPTNAATKSRRNVMRSARQRCSSRKQPERRPEIEARPPQGVLGQHDFEVGIARATLGVDDFDVGGRPGTEADVDDVHDLLGLRGGGPPG